MSADASLALAGRYFASAVEASPDCVRILNLDGEVEFMNRRGLMLFEIEDFARNQGIYWPNLWPVEARPTVAAALNAALAGKTKSFRAFCPTAKGAPRWWDTILSPVFENGSAAPARLLATSRDVTSQVEMASCLESVIEAVPVALFAKDARDGRFRLINKAAEALFGHPAAEMLGKTDHEFFPKEQADGYRDMDREVLARGGVHVLEAEAITTESGETRYLRTIKAVASGPEGPRHLIVICDDITERRAAEEAREAAYRAKSEFLANMSHEVRTPLNAVLAVSDLLTRTPLSAEQLEMIGLISSAGSALTRLLTDVLDLARMDAGGFELNTAPFPLAKVIAEAADEARKAARAKGLSFHAEVRMPAWRATGDAARLKQILGNLLANAVKFTSAGGIAFEVTGEPVEDWGRLRFAVRDTGIGFDESEVDRLFGRFEQGDGSLSRKFDGSGLGLPVALALAERMGGSIVASSPAGEGATFVLEVSLPVSAVATGPEMVAQAPRQDDAAPGEDRPLRVLLAEDHPTNRRVVEMILSVAHVDLICVENGAEAVEVWGREPFDLILMDMQMPVMDGLRATRLIREREHRDGVTPVPIISVTANTLAEHIRASLEAGANLHLPKPLTAATLFDAIHSVLEAA